jgi:Arc/MetJ family transcription regulator
VRTNIEIDNALMAEAMEALGVTTKREAVDKALRDAVRIKHQLRAWTRCAAAVWKAISTTCA